MAIRLKAFSPDRSVRMLSLRQLPTVELSFIQTWALAWLLGWITLDENSAGKSALMKSQRNALRAGQIALAFKLDSVLSQRKRGAISSTELKTLRVGWLLLQLSGGLRTFVEGRNALTLVREAKKKVRELGYVYRIMQYLCRYHTFGGADGANFTLETAKTFVEKEQHEGDVTWGRSKISKIWESHRAAAPYIFAFYPLLSRHLTRATSVKNLVDSIEGLSASALQRLLRRAAFAAEVLDMVGHNVRISDFASIARESPRLEPFTADEQVTISSVDRNAAER